MTYQEHSNVPTRKNTIRICKEYLMSQRRSALIAKSEIWWVVPLPDVHGTVLDKHVAENCPAILDIYQDMTEAALAPILKAMICPKNIGLEMEWKRPICETKKKLYEEKQKQQENRTVGDEVDM